MELQLARVWAGLSLAEFDELPGTFRGNDPENPTMTKSDILVLYRYQNLMSAAIEDAKYRKANKGR